MRGREPDSAGAAVVRLGRDILNEVGTSLHGDFGRDPQVLERVLRRTWPTPGSSLKDACVFICQILVEDVVREQSAATLANKAAFVWLTLDERGDVGRCLVHAARTAHRRTCRSLSPYLEEEDLHDLLRWKFWKLPPSQFDASRMLRQLRRFLDVAAHHLAIDQLRKLHLHRFEPLPADDLDAERICREPPAEQTVESAFALVEELHHAVQAVSKEDPDWLVKGAIAALIEAEPRTTILTELNRRRRENRLEPWSMSAFNQWLFRFRKKVRQALSVGGEPATS